MSARFKFALPCSITEARSSDLQPVRQSKFPYLVVDSRNKGHEPKQENFDVKHRVPPAAEPQTCL